MHMHFVTFLPSYRACQLLMFHYLQALSEVREPTLGLEQISSHVKNDFRMQVELKTFQGLPFGLAKMLADVLLIYICEQESHQWDHDSHRPVWWTMVW